MATKEPRGQELIDRYKNNYQIPHDVNISEEMILKHWELEKRLTIQLLDSTPEKRWETFECAYTTLYSELDWLNKLTGPDPTLPPSKEFSTWPFVIGKLPKKIYEIGSGKGELISYLANYGYQCKGTEITRERGEKHIIKVPNLSWGLSDGVHLNQFEAIDFYDVVISNQVIEHLHPDDLIKHFMGVRSILIKDGRYLFTTPHKFVGPADISRVFKRDIPIGMHLKEYSYREIRTLLGQAGFTKHFALWSIPQKITNLLGMSFKPKYSAFYLSYLCMLEKLIELLPVQTYRRKAAILAMLILFKPSIFIIAQR